MHIKVPSATKGSNEYNKAYMRRLPMTCIPNNHACKGDKFILRKDSLQYVTKSMMNIRYGVKKEII
mgnify:FL=1